jgi:hypothetical protein
MGEDLLSQEAESFAEFLEDRNQSLVSDKPQKINTASPTFDAEISPRLVSKHSVSRKSLSAAERLLFAMTESVDNSEADDINEQIVEDELAVALPKTSEVVVEVDSAVVAPNFRSSSNDNVIPTSESVDVSHPGQATSQSLATSRTGSTDMFSKSLSDEDADDEEEEFTHNASASYASSCTSYAPSTLQGSRSSGVKYAPRRNGSVGVKPLPYCGVFIQEGIGVDDEEEYEEDDLTLPSEDFSVHRGDGANSRQYISLSLSERLSSSRTSDSNSKNDGTPILDQVRNDLLETVQDLAREGSSVVMSFLRQRP